jgi:hypothetical protein
MAAAAGAFVREFRSADIASKDHPTHWAERCGARSVYDNVKPVRSLAEDVDRTRFEATMGKNLRRARRDLAAAQPIECVRKVE